MLKHNKMKQANFILYTFIMLFCINVVNAQSLQSDKSVPNVISTQISEGKSFHKYDLFTTNSSKKFNEKINSVVDNYSLLSLKNNDLQRLLNEKQNRIEFTVSDAMGKSYNLLLYRVNIFAPDFKLSSSDPASNLINSTAIHYRGIIANKYSSIVAISFFENEVMGIINNGTTQLILGKLKGKQGDHILYYENDMKTTSNFSCGTIPTNELTYSIDDLTYSKTNKTVNNNCVRVYIEVDFDIFDDRGASTINYITGLFHQTSTLYENDGITLVLSEVFIWETTHNYAGDCSFEVLQSFQNATTSINGDIGHLLSYDNDLGGIAAGFNALCNSNVNDKLCFSGIQDFFNGVPTYSWSVMVLSHEMGHLLGSRHTHACVWNGNNTAIDGCGACQEEPNPPPSISCDPPGIDCNFCARPAIPNNGGTIMSYCHTQNVGINFNLGFGPQPLAVISNNINSASCLTSCAPCPTDLTLTGTETTTITHQAQNTLSSTQTIETTADVDYNAGNSITMLPGFYAKDGCVFETTLVSCSSNKNGGTSHVINTNYAKPMDHPAPLREVEKAHSNLELSVIPNPFQTTTTIAFQLKQSTDINLTVYDMAGRKIKQLAGGSFNAGSHEIVWENNNQPPGVYLAKLIHGNNIQTVKMILAK